jgi:plasmid stability protein
MRRLTTRVSEDLHLSLKRRAAAENRSVNELIVEILGEAMSASDQRRLIRERLRTLGLLAHIGRPRHVISHDAALALTRGIGPAVSEALSAERRRS